MLKTFFFAIQSVRIQQPEMSSVAKILVFCLLFGEEIFKCSSVVAKFEIYRLNNNYSIFAKFSSYKVQIDYFFLSTIKNIQKSYEK